MPKSNILGEATVKVRRFTTSHIAFCGFTSFQFVVLCVHNIPNRVLCVHNISVCVPLVHAGVYQRQIHHEARHREVTRANCAWNALPAQAKIASSRQATGKRLEAIKTSTKHVKAVFLVCYVLPKQLQIVLSMFPKHAAIQPPKLSQTHTGAKPLLKFRV